MKGDGALLAYTRIWMKGVENVYVRSYSTNDRFCDFCNCTLNFSCCYRYFYDEKITIFKLVIAPKIWTNFGGLFIMKLTDENRIEMYRLKKEGYSYKELSKKFEMRMIK